MNMPGFTAEESIFMALDRYSAMGLHLLPDREGNVVPQLRRACWVYCGLYTRGDGRSGMACYRICNDGAVDRIS